MIIGSQSLVDWNWHGREPAMVVFKYSSWQATISAADGCFENHLAADQLWLGGVSVKG